VAALRRGEPAAYERLVRQHGGRLLAVARRLLRNEDDARDAAQDAFVSAFKSIDRFEGGSQLSTWLHRIVVNAALMRIRSRQRVAEESIEDLLPTFRDDGHPVASQPEAWGPSPEDEAERAQRAALVHRCIAALPESYRVVLMLREIDDLDTAETAAALGITENAVKIRLHRARQALRTLLDPHVRGSAPRG
jgi:RNA polymerase sigma-70 factor (ECF subfamily)